MSNEGPTRNVFACLAHEPPAVVADLVANLRASWRPHDADAVVALMAAPATAPGGAPDTASVAAVIEGPAA